MATAPETVPQDKDFTELTKAQADQLVSEYEMQKELMKDSYDVTITGPILVIVGSTETPGKPGTYTVRIRFKKKA